MALTNIFSKIKKIIQDKYLRHTYNAYAKQHDVDKLVTYPSYYNMDKHIDVETLKSLDSYLNRFLIHILKKQNKICETFETGVITYKPYQSKVTESKVIHLTRHIGTYQYLDIDKPDMWQDAEVYKALPELKAFIDSLPFKATGRIMLIFDADNKPVTPHRDHCIESVCHEFIWFRTNLKKRFYMLHGRKKEYIESYSAWFDTVNQFHGAEAVKGLNFSIRVDGVFSDEFRKIIPRPPINLASTPSYWEAMELLESAKR